MKTVFVYENHAFPLSYFVLDGDFRHLDRTYINEYTDSPQKNKNIDELSNLIYDINGNSLVELDLDFPVHAVLDGAFVVTVGFLD